MRRHLRASFVVVTLAGLLSIVTTGASAQDTAGSLPGAEGCTVEPRTEEKILDIVASATTDVDVSFEEERAAKEARWDGVQVVGPAEFATQQAVRETVSQFFTCGNAGLPLSVYALWTDGFIAESSVDESDFNPEDEGFHDSGRLSLIDVLSVQVLSDGHATAVVVSDSADIALPVEAFAFYFEEVDGRWLLDGVAL